MENSFVLGEQAADNSRPAILGGAKTVTNLVSWPQIDENDEKALLETLRSRKWFRHEGHKNEEFESKFAEYCGVRFGLTVTNGTSAMEIPLAVEGIGPCDEVIVPCYTFFSTASVVSFVGATPVFCDIDTETYNIDLNHFESLITPRTRCVIPVHFAGFPVDMDRLNHIAKKHNLFVLEDCAHAHGGAYKDKKLGAVSNASTFSFQLSKNLTSGEGGIILTDDEELYQKMFSRHSCGRKIGKPWYEHYAVGSNIRLSELQASLLLTQFEKMDEQSRQRKANAEIIDACISSLPGLESVQHPTDYSAGRVYHIYMFRYNPGLEGVSRETFLAALSAEGVPCMGGYPIPLNKQPVFGNIAPPQGQLPYHEQHLPQAERCCKETVWIFQSALLGSTENGKQIAQALQKICANADALREYQKLTTGR